MNRRATGVLGLLATIVAACSSPEDAGAPAPTADERKAVAEAEAMIPAAERSAADETAPAAGKIATPDPEARLPKPAYRTPVPGPSPAE